MTAGLAVAVGGGRGAVLGTRDTGKDIETYHEHRHLKQSALVEESPVAARLCQLAYPVPWGCRDLPEGHRESSKAKPCRDSTRGPVK